jgi:YgiT-type zinc finger domain-containing protein
MNFWEGEDCEYCGGQIVEKRVDLYRKISGKYVLIENVPAGVCMECGTHYYAANVLKALEETIYVFNWKQTMMTYQGRTRSRN